MGRPMSAATKFILSLPPDLSVKEVIAKARANGIEVTLGNVYRVRRLPAATKAAAAKVSARPSTRPASTTKASGLSKSEFIRRTPATMPPKEVVAQARAAGLTFSQHYVYRIRAAAGSKATATSVTRTAAKISAPSEVAATATRTRPSSTAMAPALTVEGRNEAPAGRQLRLSSTPKPPTISQPSGDLERSLAALDEADTAIRAIYAELTEDPDLAPQHEAALRELHTRRSDLARQVGMAALRDRRASRAVRDSVPSATPPPAEASSEASSPERASPLAYEASVPVAPAPPSLVPPPPPSSAPAEVPPRPR